MRLDGNALVNQTAKRKKGGLDCADHWAHNNEPNVELLGDLAHEVLPQVTALFQAQFGQLGVGDGVVLCGVSVILAVILWRSFHGELIGLVVQCFRMADDDECGRH